MATPEDYRRYAAECLRLAQELQIGPKGAALLLEMAERWRGLAERAERRELVSERMGRAPQIDDGRAVR